MGANIFLRTVVRYTVHHLGLNMVYFYPQYLVWVFFHFNLKIFCIPFEDKYTILGKKKDYWDYICDCLGSTKGINDGIKYVKTLGDVSIYRKTVCKHF